MLDLDGSLRRAPRRERDRGPDRARGRRRRERRRAAAEPPAVPLDVDLEAAAEPQPRDAPRRPLGRQRRKQLDPVVRLHEHLAHGGRLPPRLPSIWNTVSGFVPPGG